jgi:hypothetical protein
MPTICRSRAHARARAHDFNVPNEEDCASPLPHDPAAARGGAASRCARAGCMARACSRCRPIAAGERIIEYTGEIITWPEALRRHPHDPADPNHTFYFSLDDGSTSSTPRSAATPRAGSTTPASPTARPTRKRAASSSRRCATSQARRRAVLRLRPGHRRALHAQAEEGIRVPLRQPRSAAARCWRPSAGHDGIQTPALGRRSALAARSSPAAGHQRGSAGASNPPTRGCWTAPVQ